MSLEEKSGKPIGNLLYDNRTGAPVCSVGSIVVFLVSGTLVALFNIP